MLSSRYKDNKILVIGDLMIDHYMWGTCDRISPEAPVPVVDIYKEELTLGGAGNVIQNLCSFDMRPDMLSVIGDDDSATEICRLLEADNVPVGHIFKEPGRLTTRKARVIAANHHMVRIDKETRSPVSKEAEEFLLSFVSDNVSRYKLIIVSDYLKGVLSERVISEIIKYSNAHKIPVIVDPKGTDFTKYRGATFIKPNKKEASIATGIQITDHHSLTAAAKKLKNDLDCEAIIVTLSEEGIAIYQDALVIIPTRAREVFDVTGAGDTVIAALGICLANGLTIKDSCDFANHAAAIVVSKIGSATCTVEEVERHMTATH